MTNTNIINTIVEITALDADRMQWTTIAIAPTLQDALLQFASQLSHFAHCEIYRINQVDDRTFRHRLIAVDTMPRNIADLNAAMRAIMPNARLSVAKKQCAQ